MDVERQTPQNLRQRLVEISDEISQISSTAFPEKYALNLEADGLRNCLSDLVGPEMEQANRGWAERAGRKGAMSSQEREACDIAAVQGAIVN